MKIETILVEILKEIRTLDIEKINFDNKEEVKNIIISQHNVIESLVKIIVESNQEIQNLKDEINHLKGEKGKPKFKANICVPQRENDVPRKKETEKTWKKESKKGCIKIDRIEVVRVDKSKLPADAEHKGYRKVIKQNIRLVTDNVEYMLERFYSPSKNKTYEAKLPKGMEGKFAPELKAFINNIYFACRVTEEKIWNILIERGIIISKGEISNILTKDKKEEFTKEKEDIFKVGMECTDFFHIDDTSIRHKGMNHYVHGICTLHFSAFFIRRYKNRETIKNILGLEEDEIIKKIMMSDDAKQFLYIALLQALCWLHEIRHYRKMNPFLDYNRKKLKQFLSEIWNFYDMLNNYKERPTKKQKKFLEQEFDKLFSTKTGYKELDERIDLTKGKKDKLLLVLKHPEIPLHNNPMEIAIREFVIKKRISYGTRSEDGKIAWENKMTMMDTCRKHNVSFLDYLTDIFSGQCKMPKLANIILERAKLH